MTEPKQTALVRESRIVTVHAVRWSKNILVEVQGNHAKHLSDVQKKYLRAAVRALTLFEFLPYHEVLRQRKENDAGVKCCGGCPDCIGIGAHHAIRALRAALTEARELARSLDWCGQQDVDPQMTMQKLETLVAEALGEKNQ